LRGKEGLVFEKRGKNFCQFVQQANQMGQSGADRNRQKFFRSFFQKRTACLAFFLLAAAAPSEPYHIGVWYFTLWNSVTRGIQVQQARKFYHRDDVWAGVRDYAQGHGLVPVVSPATGDPVDFSTREPKLGFYDEMQQSVVDAEIREAAAEGISFFAFYWYLDPEGHELDTSAPLPRFFASAFSGEMKYLLAPIVKTSPDGPKLTLAAWTDNVVPQLLTYMASPSYYRIAGRPMLIDFNLKFTDSQTEIAAYDGFRRAVAQRFGVQPFIIDLLGKNSTEKDLRYRRNKLQPDGFTCFNFNNDNMPQLAYPEYAREFVPGIRRETGLDSTGREPSLVYIPCGSMGEDARPWYRIEYGWKPGNGLPGPDSRSYTTRPTAAEFREAMQNLKAFMNSDQLETMNTAILYSWNEWGEGAAVLEPSLKEGYLYADIVRDVFGLVPRGTRP
jgi:hypothetical protein